MSKFNAGNSKFSRFINGKGFYIALALCLVAIGSAAYIAVNSSYGNSSKPGGNGTISNFSPSQSIPDWDTNSAAPTNGTVSNIPSSKPSTSESSSSSSQSSVSSQSSASSATSKMVFTMPVQGSIITAYSGDQPVYDKTMNDWRVHDGVDIAATEGAPVKACASGTVADVKVDDILGQMVIIDHGNGLQSIYANLTNQVTVKKGQSVETGDAIGCVGDTAQGESAIASHLHFAMTRNGVFINPLSTINAQ